MSVPVISLWQPWASLIFEHDPWRGEYVKSYETRGHKMPDKHAFVDVAIHATASFPAQRLISPELHQLCCERFGEDYRDTLPCGVILGTVKFAPSLPTEEPREFIPDDEYAAGDWSDGRIAWPIFEVQAWAEPIAAKGKQGWWRWPN